MQNSKNKLEKQFYQTFNISKTYMNCNDCPPITDSIYMELVVIIQRNHLIITNCPDIQTKEDLKELILMALLQNVDVVREEIQELFE